MDFKKVHEKLKADWNKTGLDITDICDHRDQSLADNFQGKWDLLNELAASVGQGPFVAFENEKEGF